MLRQRSSPHRLRRAASDGSFVAVFSLAIGFLLASVLVAASLGSVQIPLGEVIAAIGRPPSDWTVHQMIFFEVRVPRILTGACVGAGLALSGLVLQAALRNPLAEPYLLGISSGASLGAVSVLLLGATFALPFAAFATGLLALLLTLAISGFRGALSTHRVVLAGIAVSALFSGLTSLVIYWSPQSDSYRQVLHWLIGSLSSTSWTTVGISSTTLLVFGGCIFALSRLLEVFFMSDSEIASIGIPTARARALLLCLAALLSAGMVSVSGAIGFVGLMIAHLTRPFAPASPRRQVLLSMVLGAILLIWSDTMARMVFLPEEIPVGIATSVLGAVALCFIISRSSERFS